MKAIQNIYRLLIKYKVFHILFWLVTGVSIYHGLSHWYPGRVFTNIFGVCNDVFCNACCIYFTLYCLVPWFFDKRRYGMFILLAFGNMVLFSFLNAAVQGLFVKFFLKKELLSYGIATISALTDIFINSVEFFAVITISRLYTTDQRNKQLEKEHLETELNFLKSQINPHFLFNALNSIYVLIEEDKKLAGETLLKFSDMLRYQLYECSVQNMSVSKELAFLHDFAALEKIRNSENLEVIFDIHPDVASMQIPPFLLLPFIENAFKHISHHTDKPDYINIHFSLVSNTFIFSVINTYDEQPKWFRQKQGGIGLQNVTRRLELLYPGKHRLDMKTNEGIYSIQLKLEMNENEMYTGR